MGKTVDDICNRMCGSRDGSTSESDRQKAVEAGHANPAPVWQAMCHPIEQAVTAGRCNGGRDESRACFRGWKHAQDANLQCRITPNSGGQVGIEIPINIEGALRVGADHRWSNHRDCPKSKLKSP